MAPGCLAREASIAPKLTQPAGPTSPAGLDEAVVRVRDASPAWARLSAGARADVVRRICAGVARTAERAVIAACAAKGVDPASPLAGEEWMSGPYVALARRRNPPVGRMRRTRDGRVVVRVFPADNLDAAVYRPLGLSAEVRFLPGVSAADVSREQARFHKAPDLRGRTCVVLGAGNIGSIPVADVLTKMFVERKACVLKLSPLNAYLGPLIEESFAEVVAAGWLRVVQGGAEEGAYLARHDAVDEVHVTGSDRTHDALVWGPPGPERAARMARNEPLLQKETTSELGNVTPILVVPGPYTERDLAVQAENVAGMVTHNASFNCIAGRLLVLPRGWRQRDRFLELVMDAMARVPARAAWYPGAEARWRSFVDGRASVRLAPSGGPGTLPWALVTGLDPAATDDAYRTEPFCAVLAETSVGSEDPVEFLHAAVRFANERLWGTLAAAIVAHPETERGAPGAALEHAIRDLRYGTVCVNVWPGFAFGAGTTPWGAYPGATLHDVQSGRGLVHNTRMLEQVEKTVMRGPLRPLIKLPHVPGHRAAHHLGRRLVALEASGSWSRLPPVLAAALMA